MWCETDRREKTRDNWDEFKKRFDVRFREPDAPATVRSSQQP
jgi:hypothetical protein